MPPLTRRRAGAHLERSRDAVCGSSELLGLIFAGLPPVEQVVTVSRLSREWRAWSGPHAAALREERRLRPGEWIYCGARLAESAMPQWFVQEAWPSLIAPQRKAACVRTAYHGDSRTLTWVRDNTTDPSIRAAGMCEAAARGGHLEVLQYLQANSCFCDGWASYGAAYHGHLEVLQWLHAHGCPCNRLTCFGAAKRGNLEVLQWLHANGCSWDADTCWAAADGGHLEVLKFLHANGCPWDAGACVAAARGGHLEVLQWLHAHGCPLTPETRREAARNGNLEMVQWLSANGCP